MYKNASWNWHRLQRPCTVFLQLVDVFLVSFIWAKDWLELCSRISDYLGHGVEGMLNFIIIVNEYLSWGENAEPRSYQINRSSLEHWIYPNLKILMSLWLVCLVELSWTSSFPACLYISKIHSKLRVIPLGPNNTPIWTFLLREGMASICWLFCCPWSPDTIGFYGL